MANSLNVYHTIHDPAIVIDSRLTKVDHVPLFSVGLLSSATNSTTLRSLSADIVSQVVLLSQRETARCFVSVSNQLQCVEVSTRSYVAIFKTITSSSLREAARYFVSARQ